MVEEKERARSVWEASGLSMTEFGKKMGISKSMVANLVYGKVPIKESTKILMRDKLGANIAFLDTGHGEPMKRNDALKALVSELMEGENETARAVFTVLAEFDQAKWDAVRSFIKEVAERL